MQRSPQGLDPPAHQHGLALGPYAQPPHIMPGTLSVGPPSTRSRYKALLLAIGPGMFGVCGLHRIYTGHIGIGFAQVLTFGGCGIWQLIDIILIFRGKYTDREGRQLLREARRLM
jgi:TM2 domain-containing membrane protein YozV